MPISLPWFGRSNAVFSAVGLAGLLLIVAPSLWLTAARAVRSGTADLLSSSESAVRPEPGKGMTFTGPCHRISPIINGA